MIDIQQIGLRFCREVRPIDPELHEELKAALVGVADNNARKVIADVLNVPVESVVMGASHEHDASTS